MSNSPTPAPPIDQTNGQPASGPMGWPPTPKVEQISKALPPLHMPQAYTTVRDRWERLVTTITIPAAPEQVWRALVDPAALKLWLATCHGALDQTGKDCMLDFDDGEFFLCRSTVVDAPTTLQYVWRWLGIGQATQVTWQLEPNPMGTQVTVTEEAFNPPWDWQTWNGGGWPGILDQLAAYLRTGTEWRWPWRRVGPYTQIELPVSIYQAWDALTSASGLRFWLQATHGELQPNQSLTILMGDASGSIEMHLQDVVPPGQALPSFLPYINFSLTRPIWNCHVGGRIWIEPSGWGRSICQVVHYNWENLPPAIQLSERKILTSFWAGAARRSLLLCGNPMMDMAPHSWS